MLYDTIFDDLGSNFYITKYVGCDSKYENYDI